MSLTLMVAALGLVSFRGNDAYAAGRLTLTVPSDTVLPAGAVLEVRFGIGGAASLA